MSRTSVAPLIGPRLPHQEPPERPKYLRRIHSDPDPDLEGLSPSEADDFKNRSKFKFRRLISELASLLGGKLSNYDLAELILSAREKEGTIRSWRNYRDRERYPRRTELEKLESIVNAKRAERFGGAF